MAHRGRMAVLTLDTSVDEQCTTAALVPARNVGLGVILPTLEVTATDVVIQAYCGDEQPNPTGKNGGPAAVLLPSNDTGWVDVDTDILPAATETGPKYICTGKGEDLAGRWIRLKITPSQLKVPGPSPVHATLTFGVVFNVMN